MSQQDAPARPPAGPPPDRYGRRDPRRSRRGALIGGGLVVVLMLTWAGWVGIRQSQIPVRWDGLRFALVDDGHARLTFRVLTDPGRKIVCTVRMFNSGLTEVGRTDVTLGPSTEPTFRADVTVPTFEPATSGVVRGCVLR